MRKPGRFPGVVVGTINPPGRAFANHATDKAAGTDRSRSRCCCTAAAAAAAAGPAVGCLRRRWPGGGQRSPSSLELADGVIATISVSSALCCSLLRKPLFG